MTSDNPALYIHIPFCASRCHYCSFVSSVYKPENAAAYLAALKNEISLVLPPDFAPSTIFIGGGTPTVLPPHELDRLLASIPGMKGSRETTIEANPGTLTDEKIQLLKDHGVTRISFGVQTFSGTGLELLGRSHSAATAVSAVTTAVDAGFQVNVDLISGWPGESVEGMRQDVSDAINLGVHHLSCYTLMVESDFAERLRRLRLSSLDDDCLRAFWDAAETTAGSLGFTRYETSNFCRDGCFCRHNVDIWKGKEYYGLGVAAHSHIGGRRFANGEDREEYIRRLSHGQRYEAFSEQLTAEAKARECAVFWLRLAEGINLREFAERTGFSFEELYSAQLPAWLEDGVMEYTGGPALTDPCPARHIRVSDRCQPVLDAVLVDMI